MIAIKDMEMPKRCAECRVCITNDYGTYGKCLLQDKSVDCLVWSRDTNCPIVEIVTCKDCTKGQRGKYSNLEKYCECIGRITEDDFYCGYAESRKLC